MPLASTAGVSLTGRTLQEIHAGVAHYYTQKVLAHGPTPLGVDWSCIPTQELRFVQLLKLCDIDRPCSLNDIGCGYGALLAFLGKRPRRARVDSYLGIDLSPDMISEAVKLWQAKENAVFEVGSKASRIADYSVASGIFNVKLQETTDCWQTFVKTTLYDMFTRSRLGFAVNFLTPLNDDQSGPPELYRPPPEQWAGYCEDELGMNVTLLQSYGLREYTLIAYRVNAVRQQPLAA